MKKLLGLLFAWLLLATTSTHAMDSKAVRLWQEDLAFYKEQLEANHIDLFHTLGRTEFNEAIAQLESDLPKLTEWQVITRLMQLTRRINDGHTTLPLWQQQFSRFPVRFTATSDAFVISHVSTENENLLGLELRAINGVAVNEVVEQLAAIVPFVENRYSEKVRVAAALNQAPILQALAITDSFERAIYTLAKHDGSVIEVELNAKSSDELSAFTWRNIDAVKPTDYFSQLSEVRAPAGSWVGYDQQTATGYLSITTYPDMASAMQLGEDLVKTMAQHQGRHFIIDLRDSYGGDLFIGLLLASFINTVESIEWQHGIYVLISNKTFSAAMSNATQFRRLLNAQLVGQPTGARPNGYQDMGQFSLPHSNLLVTYSKRLFRFADVEQDAVNPDRYVELTSNDLRQGHDAVLALLLKELSEKKVTITAD